MAVSAKEQTDIAAALVRLYVFLTQYLDRCCDERARATYPEAELQAHLQNTRRELSAVLSVNPVVDKKLTEECDRILALGASCGDAASQETVRSERAVLRNKTIALSDLVALYRALA